MRRGDEARAVAVEQLDGLVHVGVTTSGDLGRRPPTPTRGRGRRRQLSVAAGSSCIAVGAAHLDRRRRSRCSGTDRPLTPTRRGGGPTRPGGGPPSSTAPRNDGAPGPAATAGRQQTLSVLQTLRSSELTTARRSRSASARVRRRPARRRPVPCRLTGVPAWRATAPSWATAGARAAGHGQRQAGGRRTAPSRRTRAGASHERDGAAGQAGGGQRRVERVRRRWPGPCRARRSRCGRRRCCRCAARRWRRRRRWGGPRRRTRRRPAGARRALDRPAVVVDGRDHPRPGATSAVAPGPQAGAPCRRASVASAPGAWSSGRAPSAVATSAALAAADAATWRRRPGRRRMLEEVA